MAELPLINHARSPLTSNSDMKTVTRNSSILELSLRDRKEERALEGSSSPVYESCSRDLELSLHVTSGHSLYTPPTTNFEKKIAQCNSSGKDDERNSRTPILKFKELQIQGDSYRDGNNVKSIKVIREDVTKSCSPESKHNVEAVRAKEAMQNTNSEGNFKLLAAKRVNSDRNIFEEYISGPLRGQTLLPSGRRSRFSSLILTSGKGPSDLHRSTTIEALTHFSSCSVIERKASYNENERSCQSEAFDYHCKERPMQELKKAVRADSDMKTRRGRSLFRSKEHKRSRARSPSRDRSGATLRLRSVRRESPSPEPARRKQWPRKVLTRSQREKKLDEWKQKSTAK